jgi:hypothetical protein
MLENKGNLERWDPARDARREPGVAASASEGA